MIWLLLVAVLLMPFAWAVVRGAPYLPTLKPQATEALALLDLRPGQTLLELGVGGGKVAKLAARNGLRVIGYEINPWLYLVARINCWPYRHQITLIRGDFWHARLPATAGVFVFGIGHIMLRLEQKLKDEMKTGTRVVSFAFELPNMQAKRRTQGLFLYEL